MRKLKTLEGRKAIRSPGALVAWRAAYALTQEQAAEIFRRERRAYQNLEAGNLKSFPSEIDDMAALYELKHGRPRRKK